MRSVVMYESMYGNTHQIADAIGQGLAEAGDTTVLPIGAATPELLECADLVVVGGPTHAHGMSRTSTRRAALEAANKRPGHVSIDPAAGEGAVRDWLAGTERSGGAVAAAFDTRARGPALLTGQASKKISKALRRIGYRVVASPTSFFVTKQNRLQSGEEARAVEWGRQLTGSLDETS
jgi:hypothetical protein